MDFQKRIEAAEAAIRKAGLTLGAFWVRVPVHGTTWQRWRNGITKPRMETWERVEAELARLPATAPSQEAA